MIASVVRWAALIACAFVTASFLFFAADQTSNASKNQVSAISGSVPEVKPESVTKIPNPPAAVEKAREKEDSGLHEFIDDGNDILTAPFDSISSSSNIWARRLIPLALCLLIYGIGGLYLARALGLRRW
jgi:hypothetical protein